MNKKIKQFNIFVLVLTILLHSTGISLAAGNEDALNYFKIKQIKQVVIKAPISGPEFGLASAPIFANLIQLNNTEKNALKITNIEINEILEGKRADIDKQKVYKYYRNTYMDEVFVGVLISAFSLGLGIPFVIVTTPIYWSIDFTRNQQLKIKLSKGKNLNKPFIISPNDDARFYVFTSENKYRIKIKIKVEDIKSNEIKELSTILINN